jgi:hypothetical protein
LGFFVLRKFIIAFSEIVETKRFNFLIWIGDVFAFEVAKLRDSWNFFFILNYEKFPPSWSGGAMNRALVFNTFFSFLEDIDIDEFNIF